MRRKLLIAGIMGLGLAGASGIATAEDVAASPVPFASQPILATPDIQSPLMLSDEGATQTPRLLAANTYTIDGQPVMADVPSSMTSDSGPAYKGGRGLVTVSGMSGMFINPTSGTLNQGQLTIQNCDLFGNYGTKVFAIGLMADYGVTDWLNVGAFGIDLMAPGHHAFFDNSLSAAGPEARVRLLKDEGWIPEVSVGGVWIFGNTALQRGEPFIAASKGFAIDPDGIFRSVRVHGGFQYQVVRHADSSHLYGGAELELPYSIYLVGEVMSKNLLDNGGREKHIPWAAGVQWKPNSVLGITAANIDQGSGVSDFWFGIGLNL